MSTKHSAATPMPFDQLRRAVSTPIARRFYKVASDVWQQGYEQPFVQELGKGTLSNERFTFYMLQDYLYLNDYAKVHALAMTKSDDDRIIERMVQVQQAIVGEREQVHKTYIERYGITREQIAGARQSAFARAYTSNMLAIAYAKPLVDVLVAVLPCAWVYADYGTRLAQDFSETLPNNPYQDWVEMYASDDFWQSAVWLLDIIEDETRDLGEKRLKELDSIFRIGVEHEYMFWDSAYRMQRSWKPEWDTPDRR
ncbi:MAG: thiaminase II [Bifidobacterium crudilactis]|nr:thiaminase II [Bifidobacterium crudilactis]MCI1890133.1 thiaminase II [Bifidobacterium crudilactis]